MTLSLRQKLFVGFGSLAAAILGIGTTAYIGIDRILESDHWVDHTIAIVDQIQTIQYNLKKAQAAYRGYLMVQVPGLLRTTYASLNLVYQNTLELQTMTSDNPSQQERVNRLLPLFAKGMHNFNINRQLCLSGHLKEVQAQFKDPENFRTNNQIDDLLDDMILEEQNLLLRRRDMENDYAHQTLLVLLLGGVISSLFAFAALLVINREVREKAKIQALLQMNEFRLFQFLEAVPVGIFIADASGKPYYVNQAGKNLLGRGLMPSQRMEELSEIYQMYLRGTDQIYPLERNPLQHALKGERYSVEDVEVHQPNGTIVPLEIWGTPVKDRNGQVQYAITVFNDITERKELERMKESLVSVVAHQLKTPVGEINGYIENMLEGLTGELNPRQQEYLMDMREISMNNFQMISSFLSLSRLERGLLKVEVAPLPLGEIVKYALRDYEKSIERKGLTLIQKGLDDHTEIMGDQEKMVECLRNLINNALKFTDKGGITLEAEVKGETVILRVKDTGTGLSEAARNQLFSQKRVLGAEASRAGAGLGLYIVKQLLKLQGGDITAESEPGKGTCFIMTLRRATHPAA